MPQLYSGQSLILQFSAGGVGSTKMNHSAWQECESSSKLGMPDPGRGGGQGGMLLQILANQLTLS